jgi:hypothetical protein
MLPNNNIEATANNFFIRLSLPFFTKICKDNIKSIFLKHFYLSPCNYSVTAFNAVIASPALWAWQSPAFTTRLLHYVRNDMMAAFFSRN